MVADVCEQVAGGGANDWTLAAELARRPSCTYFVRNDPCYKSESASCPALAGENRLLSILEGGPCWIVNPSDVGVVLVALDAEIVVDGGFGSRVVPAGEFFVLPAERLDAETVLKADERVASVRLPALASRGLQIYDRRSDASGLTVVSIAAAQRPDGDVRIVLGGVSPRPYRVYKSVEEEAASGGLDDETIEGLAERALLDSQPLSQNGFKVELAAALLRDAIGRIALNG